MSLLHRDVLGVVASFLPVADQGMMLRAWPCMRPLRERMIEHELTRLHDTCVRRRDDPLYAKLMVYFQRNVLRMLDRARLLVWLQQTMDLHLRDWTRRERRIPNDQLALYLIEQHTQSLGHRRFDLGAAMFAANAHIPPPPSHETTWYIGPRRTVDPYQVAAAAYARHHMLPPRLVPFMQRCAFDSTRPLAREERPRDYMLYGNRVYDRRTHREIRTD